MSFATPVFLVLLLALPLIVWLGRPSRGPRRVRESLSLGLRLLIALLLVLGLAGLELRRASKELSVVFLVDHSDSMSPAARRAALSYVRQAIANMGPDDRSGVIVFGAEAVVERPLSASRELEAFTSRVTTLHTNLADAIRLGMALLPADTARRMVILSDGLETAGDALEAARLASASGVQILAVPFVTPAGSEAAVTDVRAPAQLREGEQFGLEVTIESTVEQVVGVRVLSGGAVLHESSLTLRRGVNRYSLPMAAGSPGFAEYRVQIIPEADVDTFYQNNELAAFSQVAGPPRVLLVRNPAPRDGIDETRELLAALEAANILVDVVVPSGLPSELPALAEYVSVILVDVPARTITGRQMTAVQTYVRDLGGGLVAVGGPSMYGVGGYFNTPLEETLPVDMQIKDQQRRPRLTMVFVIDKSGSMSDTSGGITNMDLVKEAAIRSLDLLSPSDKVGVVAFDSSASWVVPITSLEQRDAIANAIGTIRPGGGTDIFAGVQAASQVLPQDDSNVKHMILLTDGMASPTGIAELIRRMHDDYGITLSSVGVGSEAASFLPELAEAGGGIYHFAADASSVPAIFAEETSLATRAYIIEEEFFPRQVNPSPMLAGIGGVPALLGYVGTTTKEAAQTILISSQDDPVLAAWQYGLGRSVAWTSDATGRWARNWVTWDQFVRFWAQVVRYSISQPAQSNVEVRVTPGEGQAAISVDARADSGAYLNGLAITANVVGPDGSIQSVELRQVAPGRYAGAFEPSAEGAYLIRVAGSDPAAAQEAIAQTAGWVLSYSPEYRELTPDPNFLARLALTTGGEVMGADLARIYQRDLPAPQSAPQPTWPALLLLAALLLPVDIAVRRLVVTRYEAQRAWQRVRAALALRAPAAGGISPERSEQLSSLRRAKDRAGSVRPTSDEALSAPLPPPIVTRAGSDQAPPAAPPARPAEPPPSPAPARTSATLLAKKRARDKDKQE
jgi:Mg-chelatase subunit ChlD